MFRLYLFGGDGEHRFNNIQGGNDKVDAHRYVLFASHRYSGTVKFFFEFELEQAYIEWQYNENHHLSAGLFLVPVGILNETHEPETFYGTERNAVEKNITPSTWTIA